MCGDDSLSFRANIGDIEYAIGRGELTLAQSLKQKHPGCPVSCSIDDELTSIVSLRTETKDEPTIVIKSDDLSGAGKTLSVGLHCTSIKSTSPQKSVSDRFDIALRQYVDSPDCSIDKLSAERTYAYLSYAVGQPAHLLTTGPQFTQAQAGCPVSCTFRESLTATVMKEASDPFTAFDREAGRFTVATSNPDFAGQTKLIWVTCTSIESK